MQASSTCQWSALSSDAGPRVIKTGGKGIGGLALVVGAFVGSFMLVFSVMRYIGETLTIWWVYWRPGVFSGLSWGASGVPWWSQGTSLG